MSNFSESFELIFVNEARSGAILIAETSCLTFYWAQLTTLVRTWGQENVLGLNHAFRLSFVYCFPINLNFPEFFRGLKIRLWIIKSTYKNINQISEFSGNVFDQVSSRVLLVSDKHPRVLTTNPLLSCSERKEWDVWHRVDCLIDPPELCLSRCENNNLCSSQQQIGCLCVCLPVNWVSFNFEMRE